MTETQNTQVTDDRIRKLRDEAGEAGEAGDHAMALICEIALGRTSATDESLADEYPHLRLWRQVAAQDLEWIRDTEAQS